MVTTKATPGPGAGTQSAAPLAAAVRKNLAYDAQFTPLGGAFFHYFNILALLQGVL